MHRLDKGKLEKNPQSGSLGMAIEAKMEKKLVEFMMKNNHILITLRFYKNKTKSKWMWFSPGAKFCLYYNQRIKRVHRYQHS